MFGKWSENTSITYNNTAVAMLCQHNEFPELLILFTKHRHSEENIQRDIARAAKFQERKKREMALTTSPVSSSLTSKGSNNFFTFSSGGFVNQLLLFQAASGKLQRIAILRIDDAHKSLFLSCQGGKSTKRYGFKFHFGHLPCHYR